MIDETRTTAMEPEDEIDQNTPEIEDINIAEDVDTEVKGGSTSAMWNPDETSWQTIIDDSEDDVLEEEASSDPQPDNQ